MSTKHEQLSLLRGFNGRCRTHHAVELQHHHDRSALESMSTTAMSSVRPSWHLCPPSCWPSHGFQGVGVCAVGGIIDRLGGTLDGQSFPHLSSAVFQRWDTDTDTDIPWPRGGNREAVVSQWQSLPDCPVRGMSVMLIFARGDEIVAVVNPAGNGADPTLQTFDTRALTWSTKDEALSHTRDAFDDLKPVVIAWETVRMLSLCHLYRFCVADSL